MIERKPRITRISLSCLQADIVYSRGLAALEALFGSSVPPMVTLKSLVYFNDLNEPWRLADDMKATIARALSGLPNTWEKIAPFSHTLYCLQSKKSRP